MNKYILAIDQGTTSTRAIIFDQNQNIIAQAQKELTMYYPKSGWVEQDANEIWLSTLEVLATVMQSSNLQPTDIASLGITNQRETTIIWDKTTGLPIYNAIVWQSCQSDEICKRVNTPENQALIKAKTGLIIDPYFSATKIMWIMENVPKAKSDNLLFGTVDSWLVWKLTNGKLHITDVTNASRTMLFNIHTMEWDKDLLKLFNIPTTMLPEIKDSSEIYGYCEPYHFFNYALPICSIIGDQQAALFGQSCFNKGDTKNTYGTGGFLLMNTGNDIISSNHGLLSSVAWRINNKTQYCLEGSILISGSLIQWLRDALELIDNASETENLAYSINDSDGVIIVPAFVGLGAPYWNKHCRGMILGLTRGSTKAHIARASLEAIAFQCKDLIEAMEQDVNYKIASLKVDGGACKNNFLMQFQSDILQIPVTRSKLTESTALGAARMAGLACGMWTMEDFNNDNTVAFNPLMDTTQAQEKYTNWLRAVNVCLEY